MVMRILFFGFEMEKYDLVNKHESWFEVRFPGTELAFLRKY